MPTIVRSSGGGGADISALTNAATASEVLEGHQFYGAGSDEPQEGTMVDHSAKTTIDVGETGGAGYYSNISVNGASLGNVTAKHVLTNVTFTDSNKVTQNGSIVIRNDPNANVAVGDTYINTDAGYYSQITIKGPTLSGNAEASHVLTGKSFYSNTGTIINGSMKNYGALTGSVAVGGTYTNTNAGYYSSIQVTGPTLSGNAAASHVLTGKSFYSNTGTIINGSMKNHGSISKTISPGDSWTGAAGYYSGITISASSATTSGNASNDKVLYGYTYMNSSGAQTGSLRLYCYKGDISTSWMEIDLGWTPTYYGATTSPGYGEDARTKCYLSGTTLYVCHNGSGTWNGRIIAST